MSYDEVEIEDMEWSEELQAFTYQCPCGDLFQITLVRAGAGRAISPTATRARCAATAAATARQTALPPCPTCAPQEELRAGEDIARCPSCSLFITVIYNPVSAPPNTGEGEGRLRTPARTPTPAVQVGGLPARRVQSRRRASTRASLPTSCCTPH